MEDYIRNLIEKPQGLDFMRSLRALKHMGTTVLIVIKYRFLIRTHCNQQSKEKLVRNRRYPTYLDDYYNLARTVVGLEPSSCSQVFHSKGPKKWLKAMSEEIELINKNMFR